MLLVIYELKSQFAMMPFHNQPLLYIPENRHPNNRTHTITNVVVVR